MFETNDINPYVTKPSRLVIRVLFDCIVFDVSELPIE